MSVNAEARGCIEITKTTKMSIKKRLKHVDFEERTLHITNTKETETSFIYEVYIILWNTDDVYASKALEEMLINLNVINYTLQLESQFRRGNLPYTL